MMEINTKKVQEIDPLFSVPLTAGAMRKAMQIGALLLVRLNEQTSTLVVLPRKRHVRLAWNDGRLITARDGGKHPCSAWLFEFLYR